MESITVDLSSFSDISFDWSVKNTDTMELSINFDDLLQQFI